MLAGLLQSVTRKPSPARPEPPLAVREADASTVGQLKARISELRLLLLGRKSRKAEHALAAFRGDAEAAVALKAADEEHAAAVVELENLELALEAAIAEQAGIDEERKLEDRRRSYAARLPGMRAMEQERREQIERMIAMFEKTGEPEQAAIYRHQLESQPSLVEPPPPGFVEQETTR